MPRKPIDLVGQTFHRLTVRSYAGRSRWNCVCTCGKAVVARGDQLKSGETKSCGCYTRELAVELARSMGRRNRKHGGDGTPLYGVWRGMIERCYSPANEAFKRYGARGIRVCDAWREDFGVFQKWALANGYESGLSIDRIDNDGGYTPENCRWVTRLTQGRNRSTCVFIEGRCVAEWADTAVVSRSAVYARLRKGWDIHSACNTPRTDQGGKKFRAQSISRAHH